MRSLQKYPLKSNYIFVNLGERNLASFEKYFVPNFLNLIYFVIGCSEKVP